MPHGLQRRRTRGWRKPVNAVIVDRTSRWGNPFTVEDAIEAGYEDPRRACVSYFDAWLDGTAEDFFPNVFTRGRRVYDRRWILGHLHELRGRDLLCTCPADEPWCHRNVLLRRANEEMTTHG